MLRRKKGKDAERQEGAIELPEDVYNRMMLTVIKNLPRGSATRYLVDLEVDGIAGIFAAVAGKEPPGLRYWVLPSMAPAFVRFEGTFFLNGPLWNIELASPRWPK